MNTYKVTYTKKVGVKGIIVVKANNEIQAISNAKNLCFSGSNFTNARITSEKYIKPRKQGFAGRN